MLLDRFVSADTKGMTGCDVLAHPPDEDSICDEMEFELLEDEPINTYLLHPSDSTRSVVDMSFC